ncbi:unnamed protein product [Phytophthora fragariaefolia]|uniref:Unnamed protein product n=1 Tax=Phytophthora fragariaefolia TaxID=1490495 RepID=A0A9W6Y960_9STRA|nr:unnamed protein product [Phytophthora fragariaefolia]
MPWLARYQPEIDWLVRSQRFPPENYVVEQRLPLVDASVEQRLPFADVPVAQAFTLRDAGVVESELPCLEGGDVSPSEPSCSETSVSSSGSRRLRKSQRNRSDRHRLRPRATTVKPVQHREGLNVAEYEEGLPTRVRTIEVANPPSDAAAITRFPGLSWKHLLRDLKAGETEQICLLTSSDQPAALANTVSDDNSSSRPKAAEPKSVREERFAAQSWTALQVSNNPVYPLAREFEDIFPEKIPAELPAERGVRHEIDLVPGSNESDIPLTAVSTPSGMLWEWLVMPQGLKNALATFNRMVSHVLRPLRAFAPSYFYDIFVHSRAENGLSAIDVHLRHLRQVFEEMRENKLNANLKKCVFCAPEIPVLGCYVSKDGVRADPEKISSICSWPTPKNQTELRQWLGLANYLHKYTKDYASLIQPMSSLLKKDVAWD